MIYFVITIISLIQHQTYNLLNHSVINLGSRPTKTWFSFQNSLKCTDEIAKSSWNAVI